jgi:8-oxo-dGTP diphosphatase / 2-hydroxy-dATP diphosphatase
MLLTLVIVHQNDRVLLGMKKRGFGAGKINGFGGKLEPGESLIECAVRELKEESGLIAEDTEEAGRLVFKFNGYPEIMDVHIFKVRRFSGLPCETAEMAPAWYNIKEIPFGQMWPDDKFWFPYFLAGKNFKGYFLYSANNEIMNKEVYEL